MVASREVATFGPQLLSALLSSGTTVLQATPATWQLLLVSGWQGNSRFKALCGGESLSRELANRLLERGIALWNLYGPTETTIWSAAHPVGSEGNSVPIGRPIANTQFYLLDSHLQPVPVGVPGELYIGGAGLALGYLNRPELTAEKFIPNPFSDAKSNRLYKTGDLARYLVDGNIEYLGRLDHQFKIRGFRIESGEIEAVLSQHPGVQQAVAIVREDVPGDKRLVTYVVPHPELKPTLSELRRFLKEQLPDYMVPSVIMLPQKTGYFFQEGMIFSPDGHCRAFDAKARGTVSGSGVGIVVLKRLEDAIADGDFIHAVIKGSAINNDGSVKVGYTAPSVDGQAEVIAQALAMAEVEPDTVTYVEAHGTGTSLGDPIEIAALTQAFRAGTQKKGFCAVGSMKTNIGHLDTAAGVTGLIKTVLALKHKLLPPSLHFEVPNPKIDFANSPFYVNTKLCEWKVGRTPRRAGVSSFGIGGTNAHVVLEEAPMVEPSGESRPQKLLVLSAKTSSALETANTNLVAYFKQHPDANLADVAYTYQVGRRAFSHRRILVCRDLEDAALTLETLDPKRVLTMSTQLPEEASGWTGMPAGDPQATSLRTLTGFHEPKKRKVVFMFPGQGTQYVNMARELYQVEPVFREQVDLCSELLKPHLGLDLRQVLYPNEYKAQEATQQLKQTAITQPALFVIEYALAMVWMHWGVHPQVMIGHSIGEYVAACLAGVFSLEDALMLVAARGRLMQKIPSGDMLAVLLPELEVQPLLGKQLSLAAINGPSLCVVSDFTNAVDQLEGKLSQQGVECQRLHTSHAFHSEMMEPILGEFTEQVKHVNLQPPKIPYLSNLTGTWITAVEATTVSYWTRHLRSPVRFDAGLRELLKEPERVLLEVGPGWTLTTLARRHPDKVAEQVVLTSLRHPHDQNSDEAFLLNTLGQLWLAGIQINWSGFYAHERRHRLPLPTYPFEHQRYWIELQKQAEAVNTHPGSLCKKPDVADWFYIPNWKQSPLPQLKQGLTEQKLCWLVFIDECGLGSQLVKRLEQEGQDAITVMVGGQFSKQSARGYTINPRQPNDYEALLTECALDKTPKIIAHFWNVTPNEQTQSGIDLFEKSQELGFLSLLFLAQALGAQNMADSMQIAVLSNNMQQVTGEEVLCPQKATVLGPCKVIPQEYPHIICRSIDVVIPSSASQKQEKLIDQLLAELKTPTFDNVVAYRGEYRWVQTFEPVRLDGAAKGITTRLRQGGVYLITGGLGGIGFVLAEYLAQTLRAKLLLVGRKPLPDRDKWVEWLATHDKQDDVSSKIRKVQALEKLGAEVLAVSADVADREQMQAAIAQTYQQFGAIHGVIHAAGIAGGGMIQLKAPEIAASVLAPKVKGTLVLELLFKDVKLDFLVLLSSITSVLCTSSLSGEGNSFSSQRPTRRNVLG
ncbi:MAG: SDR family NAD(P)-dependent oxidoreductase [Chroococcidiopsidaceae cyanobacterium CP_BM_ER_R8_30]|nr:SDR family NAD(P)-dependent oxidoreductase [Chroococcidiopsidaceae cyanobacterium CP_BM_ER_R8_30]